MGIEIGSVGIGAKIQIPIDHCSRINYDLNSTISYDSLKGVIYIGTETVQGDELKYWDKSICLLHADKASNQYIHSALAERDRERESNR